MSATIEDAGKDSKMDIHEILQCLPHRYPILLVDRVLEVVPGERIRALKNVSINEPFFPGHYPHHPVMRECSSSRPWPRPRRFFPSRHWAPSRTTRSVYYFVRYPTAPGSRNPSAG